MTRITQDMTARMLLADIGDVSDRLARTQQRIASGKQLTAPSDDPFATSRALQLRSDLEETRQYTRNVQEATAWQSATDAALSSIGDLTLRARELLVQGANGALSDAGRTALASELHQVIDAIKGEANAQYGGRAVFGGTATTGLPYATADDDYHGDSGAIYREIGKGVQVQVNVAGGAVIGDSTSGLIAALRSAESHLSAPDAATVLQGDLAALDTAHDALTNVRAGVGALGMRLDTAASRLADLEGSTTKLLSDTEDADMAKTLVDYSTQQAVYQAALKAGANLIQPSLLDFLR